MNPRTIYALASAPGKAGVSVFRVSGPKAFDAFALFGLPPAPHAEVRLSTLVHRGEIVDKSIVLAFHAPNSFTGEDVVEFHTHGSPAIKKRLFSAFLELADFRQAEPGEFARRAFMHGKLDLTQAESLADLIAAETESQRRQAMRGLEGFAGAAFNHLRGRVLEPLALLEAYLDFPDEEIPETVLAETRDKVATVAAELSDLLQDNRIGERVRDGLSIAVVGPPNAGKSSLVNALARREVAIVSPEAGTTRDLIEVSLDLGGYAVTLIDTAGLREAENLVESEGIRRARALLDSADLTLLLLESAEAERQFAEFRSALSERSVLVINKTDLAPAPALPLPFISLSLKDKSGAALSDLVAHLSRLVEEFQHSGGASPIITQARHREALTRANAALQQFSTAPSLELQCEALRYAATAIGNITGKIYVDDVLDLVFSRFCIGK